MSPNATIGQKGADAGDEAWRKRHRKQKDSAEFLSESMISGTLPIFDSERGTGHDRTLGETRLNAGRDAIERGTAFADKYRARGAEDYLTLQR